jgi:hypothetical protein
MGMFDSLYVQCECGKDIEFQSKSGDCSLNAYNLCNCPPSIAGDLINQTESCECGRSVTLRGAVVLLPEWRRP